MCTEPGVPGPFPLHRTLALRGQRLHPAKIGRLMVPAVVALVVVAVLSIVYGSQAWADNSKTAKLPSHVAETRDLILAAVRAASIDDLAAVIETSPESNRELNRETNRETKTDFGFPAGTDPITELKKLSADGDGREILAALGDILDVAPATLPLGKDLENNLIYVWPYLAERPLDRLSGPEQVDLYRLVPAAKVSEMRAKNRWTWWRLTIGADGSWIAFKKPE